jgi:16S rRNA (cytosine967-C5)-methyltransferase
MSSYLSARSIAARVLVRVELDQAFAAAVLDAELRSAKQLDVRDRRLATELAYGTLRTINMVDEMLLRYAKNGIAKLEPLTRAHLRVGAYQLMFLTKTPAFAVVNEAVNAVREKHGPRLAGFVNAVLRKVASARESFVPETVLLDATPLWLRERLIARVGREGAAALVGYIHEVPPVGLCVPRASERAAMVRELESELTTAVVQAAPYSPLGVLVREGGAPQKWRAVVGGRAWVQEEGSQLVALLVGAQPGERVLDVCAGRGHKTAILANAVGSEGRVVAADLHEAKLDQLKREAALTGWCVTEVYPIDWSVGAGGLDRDPFDAVLVDAPCTGTGTLRRRPEIAGRRTEASVAELADLQFSILTNAARCVRAGGRLVYSVCTVLPEEGEGLVARFLASEPSFALSPFPSDSPVGSGLSELLLAPHTHGTDGYFVANLAKCQ